VSNAGLDEPGIVKIAKLWESMIGMGYWQSSWFSRSSTCIAFPSRLQTKKLSSLSRLPRTFEILEQINVQPEDRVLIIGAGRLGQLVASVIKRTGCELDVIARHQKQRDILVRQNIHTVPVSERITRKYDIIVEATGSADGYKWQAK
jgi:threonine dehydrogenase-like Zn-dependent dehydrogenase